MEPSFVTCPTIKTGMPLPLASSISLPADSLTWLTLPGADSRLEVQTVCIESTTITRGVRADAWVRIASNEFSARISRLR